MKRFARGLIVGKFSPLHWGHDLLIQTATKQCKELVIISYSRPEFAGCNSERRAHWLNTHYPWARVFVLEGEMPDNSDGDDVHREFTSSQYVQRVGLPLDAVFTSENYGDGFADYIGEYLIRKGIQHFPVVHVNVDQSRKQYAISGSQLRQDIHNQRQFLPPLVYADFVETVCFLGAESTGKSTLAEALANEFSTSFVAEYGRTLWEKKKGQLEFEDYLLIAHTQIGSEQAGKLVANRFLFADTSPLTTLFYCLELEGRAHPELMDLSARRYTHTFLCAPDFPLVQDGTRSDENFRRRQNEWYVQSLKDRVVSYTLLEGDLDCRIALVKKKILMLTPKL